VTTTETARSGRWKAEAPPARAWKGRKGRTRDARTAEQDHAAGGRHRRTVDLGDGRFACASIELKVLPKTRRIRAYLRWSDKGRSPAKYVGEVDQETRAANLAQAWQMARASGLLVEEPSLEESQDGTVRSESSWASTSAVRAVMRANKSRDTRPEMALRSAIHAIGMRYRVGVRPLAGVRRTADLVFTKAKVAVFLDGCYWHGCPEHHRPAKRNSEFWTDKIEKNRARDVETDHLLREAGWEPVRVWEHEDPVGAAERIAQLIRDRRSTDGA